MQSVGNCSCFYSLDFCEADILPIPIKNGHLKMSTQFYVCMNTLWLVKNMDMKKPAELPRRVSTAVLISNWLSQREIRTSYGHPQPERLC